MNVSRLLQALFCVFFFFDLSAKTAFVFIITSYNNAAYYKKNIDSVLMQDYDGPFRVIYIDDCSTDGTGDLVEAYVKSLGVEHLFTIIKNKINLKKVCNFYLAAHMCHDDEVLLDFDGDDRLPDWHVHVLSRLDQAYQDPNVWVTYGNYCCTNGDKNGNKAISRQVIEANAYRDNVWCTSHLKTFYAKLCKLIKKEDLMHNGKFIPIVGDQAIMFPILEMSGGRFKFIDEILYVYNNSNPLNDNKVHNQIKNYFKNIILKGHRYQPLSQRW